MTRPRWDHVVVGAGSAGVVVAARLAERSGTSVLLLEAGTAADHPDLHGADFTGALAVAGRTWEGLTARLTATSGLRPYARGRGVGGSAAVNAMLALRGLPGDYDRWAALGCAGWAWRDVAPVFRALEHDRTGRPGRGTAGATPLAFASEERWSTLDRGLRTAAAALGHPATGDPDAPDTAGFSPAALTVAETADGGLRRCSPVDTHLLPALARRGSGLVVRGEAPVDRVLFEGRRACGVRLADGEELEAAHVTVCAGALHTPAILLRSGVRRPGVGANLQDHPAVRLVLALRTRARARPGDPVACTLLRITAHDTADLQVLPLGRVGPGDDGARHGALLLALMQVRSRGTVTLSSPDPLAHPAVDFALLASEQDRAPLRAGIAHLLTLARHPAVADLADEILIDDAGTPMGALDELAAAAAAGRTDALDEWLLRSAGDYVHAAGTCRMGDPSDPMAVVDPACRVIGHSNLAVVDASVMPVLPRANTHLPTLMIAEKVVPTLASS